MKKLKLKVKELKNNIAALYLAFKRNDVSIIPKILIIIIIGYALSPVDLIPDFIPIIGYIDDIIIIPILIIFVLKIIPKNIMEECKEQSKDLWINGKPKKWYYAIPIIIIWLFIIYIIFKIIFIK